MSSHKTWNGDYDSGHQWAPVGFERIPQFADDGGPIPGTTSYRMSTRLPDLTVIIRACRECPEVWVQQFDFGAAVES